MTDRDLERIAFQAAQHPDPRVGSRLLREARERHRSEQRQQARRRKAQQHEPLPSPTYRHAIAH